MAYLIKFLHEALQFVAVLIINSSIINNTKQKFIKIKQSRIRANITLNCGGKPGLIEKDIRSPKKIQH